MNIVTNQISLNLTKTQINTLIAEAMADNVTGLAIKRILAPLLAGSFTQFPQHTLISLGDTHDDGSVTCTLKQAKATIKVEPKPKTPSDLKSIEPLELESDTSTSVDTDA